jgi:hypothetical protein
MSPTFRLIRRHPLESVVLTLLAIGAAAAAGHWAFGPHLPHYNNSVRVRALTVGTRRSAVVRELGDPVGTEGKWTLFVPSPTAEDPIRIRFNNDGRLAEVDAASK